LYFILLEGQNRNFLILKGAKLLSSLDSSQAQLKNIWLLITKVINNIGK